MGTESFPGVKAAGA